MPSKYDMTPNANDEKKCFMKSHDDVRGSAIYDCLINHIICSIVTRMSDQDGR